MPAALKHGFLQPDATRELSERGRLEVSRSAQWLTTQLKQIDWVIVSPYVRAQQSWELVAQYLSAEVIEVSEDIIPEANPSAFAGALMARLQIEPAASVLIVSHMPFVCYLVDYLDASVEAPLFPTAGIAEIELEPLLMSGTFIALHAPQSD